MNSRRVITGPPVVVDFSDAGRQRKTAAVASPADDYAGRLLKYIPAEIVAAYLVARGIVLSATPHKPDIVTLTIVAIVSWMLVPAYFYWVTTRGSEKPLTIQIVFATIAFPIWVFAIGGAPVSGWTWFEAHQYVGSVVLVFATLIFGKVQPPFGS